ncbi:MAG: alcohol dehydrogenase catalytic domain-containing protein [Chloroflexota bacterium]|nr:alcohol dehydrogenase catalytic domain-containing protein [Chloroflexota bacterium]MDE2948761.1 alcohol dehydrogenase catalytic domain-containing protein [Chloroflexota bacterium]
MKALVWEAARTMSLRDETAPTAAADEILVRVGHAGICGSELSGYLGHNALRAPPLIMGHEFAGEIVDMGPLVPAFRPDLTVGALVTVNPLWYCGDCEPCAAGVNQLCANRRLLGAHRPGAFAEFISVPAKLALLLPEGMDTRAGALTEPVGCAVRIAELAGDVADADCLVIGAGPIGLLSLQMLRHQGAARVFIAEIDAARLEMGAALGGIIIQPREVDTVAAIREATDGAGVAVSVDAVGTALTREQCVAATKTSGRLILSGLHEESSAMPVAAMIRSEIRAQGSFAYTPANFARALELLGAGAIRLDPWIHEAPLAEGGAWFERLIEAPGDVSKVLLIP